MPMGMVLLTMTVTYGLEMTASWPTSGIRWITATVTDDDGASDSAVSMSASSTVLLEPRLPIAPM